uniref:Cingulin b n=1 Tax=Tetraodon nigroviridis TaxID=99883 RepID=H3DKY2_TETNG
LSADKKPLVDYGVQIRFIKDLHDTGGGYPDKSRANSTTAAPSNKYGVAVRVQGISGQPYVVLKDGGKGDSYGVQLNTPSPTSGPPSPASSLTRLNKEPTEIANPYSPAGTATHSPASPAEDEDGLNGVDASRGKVASPGLTGSLGRKVRNSTPPSEPPASSHDEPVSPVDTNSLTPVNKLISKFNNGTPGGGQQTRGRSGARQRLKFDERRRSRSLDARKDQEANVSRTSPTSPTINPYAAPLSASSTSGSLAKSLASVSKATAFEAPRQSFTLPGKFVEKEAAVAVMTKPAIPPRSLNPTTVVINNEESHMKQTLFNILKEGTADSESSLRKKVDLIYETTTNHRFSPIFLVEPEISMKELCSSSCLKNSVHHLVFQHPPVMSLEQRADYSSVNLIRNWGEASEENHTLQEQVSHFKKELQQAHDELAAEDMSREAAESHLHLLEDQLAELQEELRISQSRASSRPAWPPQDVMTLQADLAEATMLRQRQEETLRLRERELTALKGALKEEVECHDKEMEALREQYTQDMDNLRSTMEEFTQSQDKLEEERERVNASMLALEDELESCRDQGEQWKMQLHSTTQELQKTRLEKEDGERKLQELQDSLLAMKKQAPSSDSSARYSQELQEALKQAEADLDKQRRELNEKREALQRLKQASGEKEAELLSEVKRLKERSSKDKAELEKALEKAKEVSVRRWQAKVNTGKTVVEHSTSQELQEANTRLRERLARMVHPVTHTQKRRPPTHALFSNKGFKSKLHSSAPRSSEAEEAMEALEDENRALKSQLEEAKRGATRLSKERDELTQRLEERDLEREVLKRGKSDLEEQKRLLDRALEKINKEMELMMEDSRQSVAALQSQLDDYRERSRKDLQEAQRNTKDRLVELQRAQTNLKAQQDEVSRLKKELLLCSEERDSAQLERDLLNNRFKHLESELESEKSVHTERTREVRGLEDKIKTLEIELDEERSSVELLNDRISRSRDQVDQLRSELMQERSERHDLEMDKSALERQLKELKSRIADMEAQTRPSAGLTLLENKVQELEERLRSEEREKSSILASQRRMERKLKEVNATLDQERIQHVEQRDQLSLRVKALKRQVDESEGEVERLEGVRRKVLRDLEEQQELREALHAKVSALENELKRKSHHTHRAALGAAALNSEDEDDFYDTNISSILSESHLQSSNC